MKLQTLKKSLLIATLITTIQSSAFADTRQFSMMSISPSPQNVTIGGKEIDSSITLGAYHGNKSFFSKNIGLYGGIEIPVHGFITDGSGTSNKAKYGYGMLNLGLSYTPTQNITLLGGVGYTQEKAEGLSGSQLVDASKTKNQTNVNAAIMYRIQKDYSVSLGYNTASSAYSIGFSLNH